MNPPPFPLVGSGRRLPSAGPGRQLRRPAAGLAVLGLAAALMFSPAIVAVLSMIFAGRADEPGLQSIAPFDLLPILVAGRVLLTLALATGVMRATELE